MDLFTWRVQFPELSHSARLALMAESCADWLQVFAMKPEEFNDRNFYLELEPITFDDFYRMGVYNLDV